MCVIYATEFESDATINQQIADLITKQELKSFFRLGEPPPPQTNIKQNNQKRHLNSGVKHEPFL